MAAVYQDSKYEIATSEYHCGACGEEIACESRYFSAVFFKDESFQRNDFCPDCWEKDEPTDDVFAFWRTRRPPQPTERPRRVRFDVDLVFNFFRRLVALPPAEVAASTERGEPQLPAGEEAATAPSPVSDADEKEHLGFVFALLLIRKKVLTLDSTAERKGREWIKVTERKEPCTSYWIRNPNLNAQEMERVKVKIGELLQMQL